jgi:HlyD family secretion protein
MKRAIVITVVAAAALVLLLIWFSSRRESLPELPYEIAKAIREPMWVKVSATGLIEPVIDIEVKSKASGVVVELPVEEGDAVTLGQVIARLDPTEVANELEREQAALAVAVQSVRVQEAEIKRMEALAGEGLVSERDLEVARLELERAQSEETSRRIAVANWQEKLDDTVLRSPLEGIVLEKLVEVGQVISSGVSSVTGGTSIAVIADLTEVYVKADVDETDIGRIERGMKVVVTPDAFPDLELQGVVERISPQSKVVQNVTTFEVVTKVRNEQAALRAGMNATVEIVVAGKDEALTVPRKAVRNAGEVPVLASYLGIEARLEKGNPRGRVVFVKDGEALGVRQVEVGLSDWNRFEITEGLSEGDDVLVFMTSRALEQAQEFIERRRRTAMPGMRKSSN